MKKTIVTVVLAAMLVCGILYAKTGVNPTTKPAEKAAQPCSAESKSCGNPTTKPAEKTAQPSKEELMKDVSYCIGMDIANAMKAQDIAIDSKELLAGFEAVLGGTQPRIAPDEAKKVMTQFSMMMQKEMMEKSQAANADFVETFKKKEGVKSTENGILYRVIKSGEGKSPAATDKVTVHYQGSLTNGQVFDSSYKRNEPTSFPVNGVIPGWSQVLQMMSEGDKWEVMIPSDLAYGPQGIPNVIPPNSILVFEIDLIKVEEAAATTQPAAE